VGILWNRDAKGGREGPPGPPELASLLLADVLVRELQGDVCLGFGRILASETVAPNTLAKSGMKWMSVAVKSANAIEPDARLDARALRGRERGHRRRRRVQRVEWRGARI
jgi:hypothetical protein